jgi:hypothetical protein
MEAEAAKSMINTTPRKSPFSEVFERNQQASGNL